MNAASNQKHVSRTAEEGRNIHVLHFRLAFNFLADQGLVPNQK